jgi:hypothetical protein
VDLGVDQVKPVDQGPGVDQGPQGETQPTVDGGTPDQPIVNPDGPTPGLDAQPTEAAKPIDGGAVDTGSHG